ncbi:hypothetical protein MSP8887_04283 [Marinomonas spartinae]|nr:hypothetical protein MSP8887_04283 [Marinomonas spartinae]
MAKKDEKTEFILINEHFESVFNKVLASAVVVQKSHDTNKES